MRKSSPRSLPTLSLRIDLDPEGRIGPGKVQLLENIRSCGSISAAGRAMNMSYRQLLSNAKRPVHQRPIERAFPCPLRPSLPRQPSGNLAGIVTVVGAAHSVGPFC